MYCQNAGSCWQQAIKLHWQDTSSCRLHTVSVHIWVPLFRLETCFTFLVYNRAKQLLYIRTLKTVSFLKQGINGRKVSSKYLLHSALTMYLLLPTRTPYCFLNRAWISYIIVTKGSTNDTPISSANKLFGQVVLTWLYLVRLRVLLLLVLPIGVGFCASLLWLIQLLVFP